MADQKLRALERRLENGDEADVLAYLAELERSGALKDESFSSDLRPGLQKKILDVMRDRADHSKHRDDILGYMKAVRFFSAGAVGELSPVIEIALLDRGVDPVALWSLSHGVGDMLWDDFLGPVLDAMEERCQEIHCEQLGAAQAPIPPDLENSRRIAAGLAVIAFEFEEDEVIDWGDWQFAGDVWYRAVHLQPLNEDGEPYTQTLSVQFVPRSSTILNTWLSAQVT